MKKLLTLVGLILFTHSVFSQILITEIMYNPPEAGTDTLEYLELYNNSASDVNLLGWTFPEGVVHEFGNITLKPGEYLIVCVNLAAFQNVFGTSVTAIQWTSGALNNSGEAVSLANSSGQTVFRVVYSNGPGGWYAEADGNGASIELCNFEGDPNNREKWRPSVKATGIIINNREILATPGAANSTSCDNEPDFTILIGDFFFNPADITIEVGQTIRWQNASGSHNVNGSQMAFPANPASFSSGTPMSGNWTFDHTFNIPGFYRYRCDPHAGLMTGTVTVNSNVDPYPMYTIGEVRGVDAQGVADSLGVTCSLEGVLYGVNQRSTGIQMTVIDDAGDGIGIFTSVSTFGLDLSEGNRVRIWGEIAQFRGLLQMNLDGMELISTGNPLVNPVSVNDLNEETESRLVVMHRMSIVDPADWTNNPNGFNVRIQDESQNEFIMRIARNVDMGDTPPSNATLFDLIGVGGQFSSTTSAPFLDGYQLLPRYAEDLRLTVSVDSELQGAKIDLFPNPASERIFIRSDVPVQSIIIRNLSGMVVGHFIDSGHSFDLDVNNLHPGFYLIELISPHGSIVRSFVKK